jgi:hypothetical protein
MKRPPFIADVRTLRWCARRVKRRAASEDSVHFAALFRAADELLETAPRLVKPRELTLATTLCGPVPKRTRGKGKP